MREKQVRNSLTSNVIIIKIIGSDRKGALNEC